VDIPWGKLMGKKEIKGKEDDEEEEKDSDVDEDEKECDHAKSE